MTGEIRVVPANEASWDDPKAAETSGLVAYLDGEPVGWCAVEPRDAYRRRGVSYALASAAVGFARERGAEAIEGYPIFTDPGNVTVLGEFFVGARQAFEEAGFPEVSRPSPRRSVMRTDF